MKKQRDADRQRLLDISETERKEAELLMEHIHTEQGIMTLLEEDLVRLETVCICMYVYMYVYMFHFVLEFRMDSAIIIIIIIIHVSICVYVCMYMYVCMYVVNLVS